LIRSALQAIELNIFGYANPETLRELSVEMMLREGSNVAKAIMRIDVLQHPVESRVIGVNSRFSQ
jgi:hypothetical protein